jgi:hypothetical protein
LKQDNCIYPTQVPTYALKVSTTINFPSKTSLLLTGIGFIDNKVEPIPNCPPLNYILIKKKKIKIKNKLIFSPTI